jgi:hypothetical protein
MTRKGSLMTEPGRSQSSNSGTVELLGDGKKVHNRVIRRQKITARAGHTTVVAFVFSVK